MKKFIPTSVAALSLAAAFALASPVFGEEAPAPAPQPTAQQQYDALKSRLAATQAQQEARKTAIIEELKSQNPNLTADELEKRAASQLEAELEQQSRKRWDALQDKDKGAPNIDLPRNFYKAVRGCTTDGYIYRITYNLTVNFDDLAAPAAPDTPLNEKSLLQRLIQPNPDSVLGVSGTDRFIEELKTMSTDIQNAMQVIAGKLIDEAPSDFLARPAFGEILSVATKEITADMKEQHGITVTIRADAPHRQAGRCAPAAPPEKLPQDAPTPKP